MENDYCVIDTYPDYEISKDGVVRNLKSNKVLAGSINNGGYLNYRLKNKDGFTDTLGIHRLLCMAFKPRSDYRDLQVDHLDGNKLNNVLSNLEWVTTKENCERAGKVGLSPKCIPISVLDVLTGNVDKYPSATAYALSVGMSKDSVIWRINRGEAVIYPEGKRYRKGHSDCDWDHKNLTSKAVELKDHVSGEIITFPTRRALAKYINKSEAFVSKWIGHKEMPILPGLIQIKIKDNVTPWVQHKDIYLSLRETTKEEPVIVFKNGKKYKIFTNTRHCADYFKISITNMNHRLNNPDKEYGGYSFVRYIHYKTNSPLNE